jgi:hypothetical protein
MVMRTHTASVRNERAFSLDRSATGAGSKAGSYARHTHANTAGRMHTHANKAGRMRKDGETTSTPWSVSSRISSWMSSSITSSSVTMPMAGQRASSSPEHKGSACARYMCHHVPRPPRTHACTHAYTSKKKDILIRRRHGSREGAGAGRGGGLAESVYRVRRRERGPGVVEEKGKEGYRCCQRRGPGARSLG